VFGSLAAIIAFQRNHAIRKIGFMCVNFSSDLSTRLRSLLHEKCGKVCDKHGKKNNLFGTVWDIPLNKIFLNQDSTECFTLIVATLESLNEYF